MADDNQLCPHAGTAQCGLSLMTELLHKLEQLTLGVEALAREMAAHTEPLTDEQMLQLEKQADIDAAQAYEEYLQDMAAAAYAAPYDLNNLSNQIGSYYDGL